MTINGTVVAFTSSTTAILSATAAVNAANSTPAITAGWTVTNAGGTSATVTVTRLTAGTAGNFTMTSTATTNTFITNGASPSTNGTNNTAQVDTVTPANVEIGDIFTLGYSGTTVSFTATAATAINAANGLITNWNANTTLAAIATATGTGSGTVILTAVTANTAYTFSTAVQNGTHNAVGLTIQATLSMNATGTTSNSTVASTPTSLAGQVMTIQTGTLATPTLTSASPVTQYVIGGTTAPIAEYNFVSNYGTAVIDELDFTATVTSGAAPISTLTVNGVTGSLTYSGTTGTVALKNLNLSVPVGYVGTNVPVTATWNTVGLGSQPTYKLAAVAATGVEYHVGNTTTPLAAITPPSSATMSAVAAFPTVTVATPVGSVLQASTNVEVIDVTISAPASGPVEVNSFEINTAQSIGTGGTFTFLTGTGNPFTIKDKTGNTLTSGAGVGQVATSSNFASTAGGQGVITFGTGAAGFGYQIPAGTSQTFKVFVPVNAATAGSTALPNLYANTKLVSSSNFAWTDVAGGGAATTGTTYMPSFPSTTTSSVHN